MSNVEYSGANGIADSTYRAVDCFLGMFLSALDRTRRLSDIFIILIKNDNREKIKNLQSKFQNHLVFTYKHRLYLIA